MSTHVVVNTYAHAVTYVADNMLRSLKQIIIASGLDPARMTREWIILDRGIGIWLKGQYLDVVTLEIYKPASKELAGRWDFAIEYGFTADGDEEMWTDTDAIRFAIKKAGLDPVDCDYRIVVQTKPESPEVEGWGPAELLSTDGFVRRSVGTTIGANPLASRAAYWRKS